MRKIIGFCLVITLGLCFMNAIVSAQSGAKASKLITNTTNVVGISTGPAVLYSVIYGTAPVSDYLVFFDTDSVSGYTTATGGNTLKFKLFISSNTAWTPGTSQIYRFDPPIQFNLGLFVAPASVGSNAAIVYEKGRVVEGY
jgi:hypothetical protein